MYKKGLYRQMGTTKCPPGMSKEQLKDWWINHHSITGRLVAGLQRYTINFTLDDALCGPPAFDGYADESFLTLEALIEGGTSDVMNGQIEDLKPYGLDDQSLTKIVWIEEYVIDIPNGPKEFPFKEGMYKQWGSIKCPPGMSKEQLKDWWLNTHAETGKHLPGLKYYTVVFTIEDTPFGKPAFDGCAEIWFDSLEDLKIAWNSDVMKGQMADSKKHGLDDPSLSQIVWAKQYIIPHE